MGSEMCIRDSLQLKLKMTCAAGTVYDIVFKVRTPVSYQSLFCLRLLDSDLN